MAKVNTVTGGSPQIFLYNEGNEVVDITGGWTTAFTGGNQTFTKNVDNLQIVNDHTLSNQNIRSYFQTTNLIDLTNVSGIVVEYTIPNVIADDYDFSIGINQADGSTIFDFSKTVFKSQNEINSELEILSITKVTGSYYLYERVSTTDEYEDIQN